MEQSKQLVKKQARNAALDSIRHPKTTTKPKQPKVIETTSDVLREQSLNTLRTQLQKDFKTQKGNFNDLLTTQSK